MTSRAPAGAPPGARAETRRFDEYVDRMDDRLRRLADDGDGRRRFLLMYRVFSEKLRDGIRVGRFLDGAWAESVCCHMARMYLDPDGLYERDPEACPAPWRHSFEQARTGRTNLLQDLLLGMNAHINYDLPFAVRDALLEFGDLGPLSDPADGAVDVRLRFDANLRRRHVDFLRINRFAWENILEIQDVATREFAPLLGMANTVSFRYSRRVVERLICTYRDRAWSHVFLSALAGRGAESTAVEAYVSRFAMEVAGRIDLLTLDPVVVARALRERRRRTEPADQERRTVYTLARALERRPAARAAERALIECGRRAHPYLLELVADPETSHSLRERVLEVMAETPSPAAVTALARCWADADESRRPRVLRILAAARLQGGDGVLDRRSLGAELRRLGERAQHLRGLWLDLTGYARGALLADALAVRFRETICTALDTSLVLQPDPGLARLAGRVRRAATPGEVDSLLSGPLATAAARELARVVDGTRRSSEARESPRHALAELAEDADDWLRACALFTIGRLEGPMLSLIEKLLRLKEAELLREIPAEELVDIARVADERRFRAGDVLIREGAPVEALYILVEGTVDVVSAEGNRLGRVGAGEAIGETAIASDAPADASFLAADPVAALRIGRRDFQRLLLDRPEVALAVIRILGDRLRSAGRKRSS